MLKVLDINLAAARAARANQPRAAQILDTVVLTALHYDGKHLEADVEPRRSS